MSKRTKHKIICQGVKQASEIGEFSVYYTEFSGWSAIAYEYFSFKHSQYYISPVTLHLSPATRILNENPAYFTNLQQ